MRKLFNTARKMSPAIIYIDELDTIGTKHQANQGLNDNLSKQTLDQLLGEINGMIASSSSVLHSTLEDKEFNNYIYLT